MVSPSDGPPVAPDGQDAEHSPGERQTDTSAPVTGRSRWLIPAAGLALGAILFSLLALTAGGNARSAHGARRPADTATATRAATKRAGWKAVPLAARGPVSSGLGSAEAAYRVHRAGSGFVAVSRPQDLHTSFASDGVRVAHGSARLGLRLAGVSYGRALVPVRAASPSARSNRVAYSRGSLSEWYANGPLGLEQGFDIARAPAGSRGPVTLSIALEGNLRPSLARKEILFSRQGKAVLSYRDLVASDARGHLLPSSLALSGGRLEIEVNTAGAAYPVRIDPIVQQAKLIASDGAASDNLGYAVDVSADGTTIVAGAPDASVSGNPHQGAAYLFSEPTGGWSSSTEMAKLTASDGAVDDNLGFSVAISSDGSNVVVGAPNATAGGNTSQGAAYVFTKPSGGWSSTTETAKLTASDGGAGDALGISVAMSSDGSTVAAGAYHAAVGANQYVGAAYVFTKPSGGWSSESEAAKLSASDGAGGDGLGFSVALSSDGSTVVAGAPDATVNSNSQQGAAYVFVKPGGGWSSSTQTAKLTASDGAASDTFGYSVAASSNGSTIAVGAPNATIGGNASQGAAYVFVKPGGGWSSSTETAKLTASDGAAGDHLGYSVTVASDGSEVVAGAPYAEVGPDAYQGAVYVFDVPSGGWSSTTETTKLTASDGNAYDSLGWSVSMSSDGSTIVAGATNAKYHNNAEQGTAYVFGAGALTITGPTTSIVNQQILPTQVQATLSGLTSPYGTITFTVFGPQSAPPTSCSTGGTTLGTAQISNNGTFYPSDSYTPTSTGDYWWYASYTASGSNKVLDSSCGAVMAETVVNQPEPTATISSPGDRGYYTVGESVTTSYSCQDYAGGPGISSCTDSNGSSSGTGQLDTSKVGVYTYTVTARDSGGASAQTSISYSVAAPPSASISSPSSGQTYAIGQVVPTSFSCQEGTDGPGIYSCADGGSNTGTGQLDTSTAGPHTYTVTATSSDGQTGTAQITYTVAGAPTASISSPASGKTYAVGQTVTTSFSCSEGASGPGISSCKDSNNSTSPSGQLNTSSTGSHTYTVTASSKDGQTGTAQVTYTVAAAPTATISSPASGQLYAVGQTVPTSFSCQDGASGPGISSCKDSNNSTSPSGELSTSTTGSHTYTVTATSSDGQTSSTHITYTVAGAPTATISSPASGKTYAVGQTVSTSFTCQDGTSGPGISSCKDSNNSTNGTGQLDTSATGTYTYTVTASSSDGQTSSTHITYTVAGAPSATISSPTSGQTYAVGQTVPTSYSCQDGASGPGISSCADSNGSHNGTGQLTTSTTGPHTYTVTATSSDGQKGTAQITYTVVVGPTATISAPRPGGTFAMGQKVPTSFSCKDSSNGPGISSCTDSNGSSSDTGQLKTSASGFYSYSVTATSSDGMSSTTRITYTVAARNGSGQMTSKVHSVHHGAVHQTIAFTYKLPSGTISGGALTLSVPAGWSPPSIAPKAPGYSTATTGRVSVSGRTITVSGLNLTAGRTVTIVFGSKARHGLGAKAPSARAGSQVWQTSERSTASGALTKLAVPPRITVT